MLYNYRGREGDGILKRDDKRKMDGPAGSGLVVIIRSCGVATNLYKDLLSGLLERETNTI